MEIIIYVYLKKDIVILTFLASIPPKQDTLGNRGFATSERI